MQSISAGPGFQGQLVAIGATPLQLTGNNAPLNNGVTIRALAANSTNPVYVGQQVATTAAAWQSAHAYLVGNVVKNGGCTYKCTTAGTSAGAGGPTGTAPAITDGTAVWAYQSTNAINATNAYELNASESHLFHVNDASQLFVVSSATGQAVAFDAS